MLSGTDLLNSVSLPHALNLVRQVLEQDAVSSFSAFFKRAPVPISDSVAMSRQQKSGKIVNMRLLNSHTGLKILVPDLEFSVYLTPCPLLPSPAQDSKTQSKKLFLI